MQGLEPIQGAYGRTYNSLKAAQADMDAGKDFLCANGHSYCNRQDLHKDFAQIRIRYGLGLRKAGMLTIKPMEKVL